MDTHRCGIDAALVEVEGRDQVLALRAALSEDRVDGVLELVPAARTLLIRFDPKQTSFARIREVAHGLPLEAAADQVGNQIVIPVCYDGADLADVAAATGLTRAEVINRHSDAQYTVAFCGFAPGFAYLTGLDPLLHVPRQPNPRTAVPAGSVALADEYTGIYPRTSPGGWRLIGTSELTVWDLHRDPPTVLAPGTSVRFDVVRP